MSQLPSMSAARQWFGNHPRASFLVRWAVASLITIALIEALRASQPWIPAWTGTAFGLGLIGCGLLLTIRRIRQPLLIAKPDDWAAPYFISLGFLILVFKFVSE